jgi:hypothetical protein
MREKTFPAGAVADRQGFPPPPSQIQTVTSLYGGITAFGNYDGGENGRQQLERADKLQRSAPFHCAAPKHFFRNEAVSYSPRIIRRVTVYIITHSGHLLMFLFHGGRARPKKKRELTQRVAELCFPLSHSLNLFGEHRSCVNEANEQVVGAHITQEHELTETLDTMTRT